MAVAEVVVCRGTAARATSGRDDILETAIVKKRDLTKGNGKIS